MAHRSAWYRAQAQGPLSHGTRCMAGCIHYCKLCTGEPSIVSNHGLSWDRKKQTGDGIVVHMRVYIYVCVCIYINADAVRIAVLHVECNTVLSQDPRRG